MLSSVFNPSTPRKKIRALRSKRLLKVKENCNALEGIGNAVLNMETSEKTDTRVEKAGKGCKPGNIQIYLLVLLLSTILFLFSFLFSLL